MVQSLLSAEFLRDFLSRTAGILPEGGGRREDGGHAHLWSGHAHAWADHAHLLSVQYAGAGALKTDFTRTRRRTARGVADDLANSLARYWRNNFADGFRQDAVDLFMGNYRVEDNPRECAAGVRDTFFSAKKKKRSACTVL